MAAIRGPLSEVILGHDTADLSALSDALARALVRNSSARMSVDCALYDLAAQAASLPLYRYLGCASGEICTDMTLSAAVTEPESTELVRTAVKFVDAGFRTLKVKVGAGGDDVATLVDVRRAIGDRTHLRVDANQGWSPEQAVKIITSLKDAGVDLELVEQPVPRDDIDGLAHVTRHVQTSMVADEAVWTPRDLREIIRRHAADTVNIKLAKTGGLREVASTRVLIAAGRLITEGLSVREAAQAAIAGPLTDDIAVGRGLNEMIEVYLGGSI